MWLKRILIILALVVLIFGVGMLWTLWSNNRINPQTVNEPVISGVTALWVELTPDRRDLKRIKKLLAAGADVNKADEKGYTALMLALGSRNTSPELVQLLVDAGADVNAKDSLGMTPLMYLQTRSPQVLEILIQSGADVNAKSQSGLTPLMAVSSIWRVNPELVKNLIRAGAKVGEISKEGKLSALDFALSFGEGVMPPLADASEPSTLTQVVKELVSGGVRINQKDSAGKTVLMYMAEQTDNVAGIKALVAAGADVKLKDKKGKTAAEFVRANTKMTDAQKQEVLTLLSAEIKK